MKEIISSVDWFIEEIKLYDFAHSNVEAYEIRIPVHVFTKKCKQAKAMHKQEIDKAYTKGHEDKDFSYFDSESYYKDTYERDN